MARVRLLKAARAGADSAPGGRGKVEILRWCRDVVARVNALEPEMQSRTDEALRALTGSFRARLDRGEPLDRLLPEAFAAVRQAAARTVGQRHFDVQVMGGAVLHLGKIAEMRTGEGKTLTATLPAYLNALPGAGVHVMTANDYLAGRDAGWMGPVYRFLGLETALLETASKPEAATRRVMYAADVTYGSWQQFGYDYLRDNLAWGPEDCAQRGHHFAIVDEADLILIDEMRTPLLVTAPADQAESRHAEFAVIAASLERGLDYDADERQRTVSLTEDGARHAEERLGVSNLYDEPNLPLIHYLENALKAAEFYRRDRDYILDGGQAVFIDKTSGRLHHDRRYGDGIHQAIEAKEGLTVRAESQTLAMVPMWDYLGQYQRLAGMTGTALTEADIYRDVYHLEVVAVPTNRPTIRVDLPDASYRTRQAKLAAVADDTATRHAAGQPVLIGTGSIAESEDMSRLLADRGIGHQVLTARNHEREAQVIADAARLGAVTVIAKMAGRGVDIVLGGADGAEHDQVADRGGLFVLGTERYQTRRPEMHLRGRAGRQGDPGESKFYTSEEDDLIKKLLGPKTGSFLARHSVEGDTPRMISRTLDSVQAKAAANQAAWLIRLLSYDEVLADQQHLVYAERRAAVVRENLHDMVCGMIDEVVRAEVAVAGRLTADQLWRQLRNVYPVSVTPETLTGHRGGDATRLPPEFVAEQLTADARRAYRRREAELSAAVLRELECRVILSVTDRAWREHLHAMPDLLNTIGMRTPGGLAALPEYRREAAELFARMRRAVRQEIVANLFYLKIEVDPQDG